MDELFLIFYKFAPEALAEPTDLNEHAANRHKIYSRCRTQKG